jgi:AraC-like DNA-binding protein
MIEGYQEWQPTPDDALHRVVHRMAYGYFPFPLPPEQLAPDSYLKLAMILDGEPLYFDGDGVRMDWHDGFCGHVPPTRGIVATSEAPVRCVMVNFYPSAFHRLSGRSIQEFNGRMIPPGQVIGVKADELYTGLRANAEPGHMFELLTDWIRSWALVCDRPVSVVEHVEQRIRAERGQLGIAALAEGTGLSARQLERRCVKEIGLSPKEFSSVVRFNHVYSHMQRTRKFDLDAALACGYYDESHMLKDLAFYLGKAPKRFADIIRPMVDRNLGH